MKIYLLIAIGLVLFSVTAFAGMGVDEVAKWSAIANQSFKADPRSSQVIKELVALNSSGAAVTFVLMDKSTVNLNCHNMGGEDMCM